MWTDFARTSREGWKNSERECQNKSVPMLKLNFPPAKEYSAIRRSAGESLRARIFASQNEKDFVCGTGSQLVFRSGADVATKLASLNSQPMWGYATYPANNMSANIFCQAARGR